MSKYKTHETQFALTFSTPYYPVKPARLFQQNPVAAMDLKDAQPCDCTGVCPT